MNLVIYAMLNKLRSGLAKSGIENPKLLRIKTDYTTDEIIGEVTDGAGAKHKNKMKLSENSTFSDLVKQQVRTRLKFDTIDILILDIDLVSDEIQSEIYYQYNGEKLFLKLEKL